MSSALVKMYQIPSRTLLHYPALSDKFRHLPDMKGIVSESHFSNIPRATTSRQWEPSVDPLDFRKSAFPRAFCTVSMTKSQAVVAHPSRVAKAELLLDDGLTGSWTIH